MTLTKAPAYASNSTVGIILYALVILLALFAGYVFLKFGEISLVTIMTGIIIMIFIIGVVIPIILGTING